MGEAKRRKEAGTMPPPQEPKLVDLNDKRMTQVYIAMRAGTQQGELHIEYNCDPELAMAMMAQATGKMSVLVYTQVQKLKKGGTDSVIEVVHAGNDRVFRG